MTQTDQHVRSITQEFSQILPNTDGAVNFGSKEYESSIAVAAGFLNADPESAIALQNVSIVELEQVKRDLKAAGVKNVNDRVVSAPVEGKPTDYGSPAITKGKLNYEKSSKQVEIVK